MTSVQHITRAKQLTEPQREFLQNPFVGTITDLRPDGSPHTTVVWVGADDDGVSFNTAYGRAKPRHIALSPLGGALVPTESGDTEDTARVTTASGFLALR